MSFIKEFINFSSGNKIPLINTSIPLGNVINGSIVFQDITYPLRYKFWSLKNDIQYNGLLLSSLQNNDVLLSMKGKNGLYLRVRWNSNNLFLEIANIPNYENGEGILIRITESSCAPSNYGGGLFYSINNDYLCVVRYDWNYVQRVWYIQPTFNCYNIDDLKELMGGDIEEKTYSLEYGNASSSGGYGGGSFDDSSDTIEIPPTPTIGVTNVGFVNVYNTTLNSLQNLGSELFPDFTPPDPSPLGSDVAEMLQLGFNNLVENIVNFSNMYINSNLINYVIDCHCLPITPTTAESERIKIGFKEFSQVANKVTSDYVDFDCGTLNIGEYYTNFIDYVGTRAKLYLPFIGFVDIQPEYFQSGFLQVIYRFNIIDGSFMAYVLSSSSKSQLRNSVIASYGGNACVHIPITGINYSNMISGVLNGATSIVSGHSKGQVAVNTALDTLASKPPMQSSNGYNATSAYLGIRYPYLIIEREVSNFSEKYTNEYGLPCNITKTISELSGFIQMDNIHLETLTCTDDEKTLIQNLLQNGIIV